MHVLDVVIVENKLLKGRIHLLFAQFEKIPLDLNLSLRRNWPLVLVSLGSLFSIHIAGILGLVGLIEAILVLVDAKGRRFGDKFANTQVIETND